LQQLGVGEKANSLKVRAKNAIKQFKFRVLKSTLPFLRGIWDWGRNPLADVRLPPPAGCAVADRCTFGVPPSLGLAAFVASLLQQPGDQPTTRRTKLQIVKAI
jgi:hypothetical protein